ncbi:SecDF P1 head subdomain-containing protein [Kitasatospora purpeofusca]|uniref:SecDF P1 head subdomain-containing protein n=1 Tax=Kitasatospora purpeofusca TaxID=67352 RepID=UPI003649842B
MTSASVPTLQSAAEKLRHRADALGLTAVEVTVQDGRIVLSAAGDATDKVAAATRPGRLHLRPVLALAPCITNPPSPAPPAVAPSGVNAALKAPADSPTARAGAAPSAAAPGTGDPSAAMTQGTVPPELAAPFAALDCADASQRAGDASTSHSAAAATLACSSTAEQDIWYKFALGPAALDGTTIAGAKAAYDEQSGAGWQVQLSFTSTGAKAFAETTGKLARQNLPNNQFAIVVDGAVLSHPYVREAVTGGTAQISGSFTREQAEQLAAALTDQLPLDLTSSDITVAGGTTP